MKKVIILVIIVILVVLIALVLLYPKLKKKAGKITIDPTKAYHIKTPHTNFLIADIADQTDVKFLLQNHLSNLTRDHKYSFRFNKTNGIMVEVGDELMHLEVDKGNNKIGLTQAAKPATAGSYRMMFLDPTIGVFDNNDTLKKYLNHNDSSTVSIDTPGKKQSDWSLELA